MEMKSVIAGVGDQVRQHCINGPHHAEFEKLAQGWGKLLKYSFYPAGVSACVCFHVFLLYVSPGEYDSESGDGILSSFLAVTLVF